MPPPLYENPCMFILIHVFSFSSLNFSRMNTVRTVDPRCWTHVFFSEVHLLHPIQNGAKVVLVTTNHGTQIYETGSGRFVALVEMGIGLAKCICTCSMDEFIVGSADGVLYICHSSGRRLGSLRHSDTNFAVVAVAMVKDGNRVVGMYGCGTFAVFSIATTDCIYTLDVFMQPKLLFPTAMCVAGEQVVLGWLTAETVVVNISSKCGHMPLGEELFGCHSLHVFRESSQIVAVCTTRNLCTVNVVSGQNIRTISSGFDGFLCMHVTPHEQAVIGTEWRGPRNGMVLVFDLHTGSLLHRLSGNSGSVRFVTATSNLTKIVTGSCVGTVKVYDVGTGNCVRTYTTDKYLFSVHFMRGSRVLLNAYFANTVHMLDLNTQWLPPRHRHQCTCEFGASVGALFWVAKCLEHGQNSVVETSRFL